MRKTEREWSSALFILRAVQIGLSINDMYKISFGMVMDMYIENANDHEEYEELATQEDMDNF